MYLKSILIENFILLEHANLELGPHIFFVSGENRDETSASSNGSGKSTFLQAIGWCLVDSNIRSNYMKKDDVIGPNGDYTLVEVVLDKDGQEIKIVRTRNHPEYKNGSRMWIDGESYTDHKNTDAKIQEILGLNAKTLYHAAYTDPSQPSLVALTPAEIKKAVGEILGVERFDAYIKAANKENQDLTSKLNLTLNSAEKLKESLDDKQQQVGVLLKQIEDFEESKGIRDREFLDKISSYNEQLNAASDKVRGRKAYDDKLADLNEKLKEWDEINSKSKKIHESVQQAQTKVNRLERLAAQSKTEYEALKTKVDNLQNNPTGHCNYCGNILNHSDSLVQKIKESVYELDSKYIEVLKKDPEIEKAKSDLRVLEQEEANLQHRLSNFSELLEKKTKLTTYIKALDGIENQIQTTKRLVESLDEQRATNLESEPPRDAYNAMLDSVQKTQRQYDSTMAEIETIRAQLADYMILKDALATMKVGVFNSFIKNLWAEIADCLEDLTGGDYEVTVQSNKDELQFLFSQLSKGGAWLHYSQFSTGERKRIAKAVSTALEEILNVGFTIDDEACAFIDPAGIPMMMDFVTRRNDGKTLFFVGMGSELRDYFEGERNIHIVKSGNAARAELRSM